MAATVLHCHFRLPCLLSSKPPNLFHGIQSLFNGGGGSSSSSSVSLRRRMIGGRFSRIPDQEPEEKGSSTSDEAFISQDDFSYVLKLAAGSVVGACAIKYGSILFPEITRPNITPALLIISAPMLVAILVMIKESVAESQSKDIL